MGECHDNSIKCQIQKGPDSIAHKIHDDIWGQNIGAAGFKNYQHVVNMMASKDMTHGLANKVDRAYEKLTGAPLGLEINSFPGFNQGQRDVADDKLQPQRRFQL